MDYTKFVVSTVPLNFSEDISIDTEVSVRFTVDIDPKSISHATFYLTTASGVLVQAESISYKRKVATLSFKEPLKPGSLYSAHVQGSSSEDGTEGIRSALGDPLIGSYTWRFKTTKDKHIAPPSLKTPSNASLISKTPTLEWLESKEASLYKVELSGGDSFFHSIWSSETPDLSITPSIVLEDGSYYWRVFAKDGDRYSSPSETFIFTVKSIDYAEEPWGEDEGFGPTGVQQSSLKILEPDTLPLPINTEKISFFIPVHSDDIDTDSFQLVGRGVFDDPSILSHGIVSGYTVDIKPFSGGTKISLIFESGRPEEGET